MRICILNLQMRSMRLAWGPQFERHQLGGPEFNCRILGITIGRVSATHPNGTLMFLNMVHKHTWWRPLLYFSSDYRALKPWFKKKTLKVLCAGLKAGTWEELWRQWLWHQWSRRRWTLGGKGHTEQEVPGQTWQFKKKQEVVAKEFLFLLHHHPTSRFLNLVPLKLQEPRPQATVVEPQTQHPADTVADMNSLDSTTTGSGLLLVTLISPPPNASILSRDLALLQSWYTIQFQHNCGFGSLLQLLWGPNLHILQKIHPGYKALEYVLPVTWGLPVHA